MSNKASRRYRLFPNPIGMSLARSSSIPLACAPWFATYSSSSQVSSGGNDGTTGRNAHFLNHGRRLKRGDDCGAQNRHQLDKDRCSRTKNDVFYWIPFFVLPILGGGLAQVYVASDTYLSPLLAVNIGVSAPLMLRAMAQAVPDHVVNTPPNA